MLATVPKDSSRVELEQPRNDAEFFAIAPVEQTYVNGAWIQTGGLGMTSTTDAVNYANAVANANVRANVANELQAPGWLGFFADVTARVNDRLVGYAALVP